MAAGYIFAAHLSIAILQAITIAAIRTLRLRTLPGQDRAFLRACLTGLSLVSLAGIVRYAAELFFPDPTSLILAAAFSAVVSGYESADYATLYYLDETALRAFRHLSDNFQSVKSLNIIRAYAKQYFPSGHFIIILSIFISGLLLEKYILPEPSGPMLVLSLAMIVAALALQMFLPRRASKTLPSPAEKDFLLHELEDRPIGLLRTSQRDGNAVLVDQQTKAPRTILVIVNESAGHNISSSDVSGLSLSSRLCQLGGDGGDWFMPENAVTNSSMTDISLPSILTGCGAHESIEKLHRLPTVFDLAKARGYKTAFFTSATLNWLNLDRFFAIDAIDKQVTMESAGLPITNDQGGDDYVIAAQAAEWIEKWDDDLLVVLYFNALHVPFLSESVCKVPASIVARRDRAAFIVEACHKVLFDTLKATGRYDDGLIISVGDHGETVENSVNEKGHYSRLINLPLSVLRPIFLMKPPQGLPDGMTQSLARNSRALIANIDIAPTIAHVLGVAPNVDGLAYEGFSLFTDIPPTRIAYTLNVNHWRSWDRGCVAISRGNTRVTVDYQTEDLCVYSSTEPGEDEASRHSNKEELLLEGLSQETVRNAISRIFRDKLRIDRRPGSRHGRDVSAGCPKVRTDRQGASSGPQA